MKRASLIPLSLCVAGLACGSPDDHSPFATEGMEASAGDDAANGGDDSETGEGDTGGTGDTKFDLGQGAGDEGGQKDGCQKIDFLFVIDNSASMLDEQQALIDSFPGFISTIEDVLNVHDFHIMVTDTDAEPQDCDFFCDGNSIYCNNALCSGLPQPGTCEATLGAARTEDLNGQPCPIDGNQRYLVSGQSDLADTFACTATLGGGNAIETQADALIAAVGPEHNDPGGCHEGFLRDDAILVITMITDEGDDSGGDPALWKQAIVDAKGGDEDAIVYLGVLTDGDIGGTCELPTTAPRLRQLADSFTHGSWESICVNSYVEYFLDAVSTVDLACDEFEPEG